MADQQRSRAAVQRNFWDKRLNTGYSVGFLGFGVGGISDAEFAGMSLMAVSGTLQATAALVQLGGAIPALALITAGSVQMGAGVVTAAGDVAGGIKTSWTGVGGLAGLVATAGGVAAIAGGAATVAGGVAMGGQAIAGSLQAAGGAAETFGSLALTIASFQRRWEDWKLQFDLANIEQTIADL